MPDKPLRVVGIRQRRIESGAEQLEAHGPGEGFEVVAEVAPSLQAILHVEEARLPAHLPPSVNLGSRSRNRLKPRRSLARIPQMRTLPGEVRARFPYIVQRNSRQQRG